MDDPKWLRLMVIGLVLAAIAVGYMLFTGAFTNKTNKVSNQAGQVDGVVATPAPTAAPIIVMPTATPSAYNNAAQRAQANAKTLPNTGFPAGLLGIFSIGIATAGWGLRKYPH